MMKAVIFREHGGPGVLEAAEVDRPTADAHRSMEDRANFGKIVVTM